MSQIPSIDLADLRSQPGPPPVNRIQQLDVEHFITLMITELQNQDPLNPLDNAQMLQQISQIREIGATDDLTKTLESVVMGQSISSASSLLGKEIRAITDTGSPVFGKVDKVTITDGVPRLHVGLDEVGLNNVAEIRSAELEETGDPEV